jgi:tetratricopeptide (TPR) repeat protein
MLDSSISLFQAIRDPPPPWKLGQDQLATSLIVAALAQWLRGYPDEARRLKNEALTRADTLNHPQTTCSVNFYAFAVSIWLGDFDEPRAYANRLVEIGNKYLLPLWSADGTMGLGIDLIRGSNSKEGLEQLTAGEARFARMGWRLMLIEYLSYKVRALHQAGDTSTGLTELAKLFDAVEETNERYYEPELWRLRGTLCLAEGQEKAAETSFGRAIEIAERQGSKSFQLHAACDLARLYAAHSDRAAARGILEPIYTWFTEGFDTSDLKEAKALLDEVR